MELLLNSNRGSGALSAPPRYLAVLELRARALARMREAEEKAQAELRAKIQNEKARQAVSDEELVEALSHGARAAVQQHAWGWPDKEELRAQLIATVFQRARRWQPGPKKLKEYCFYLCKMQILTQNQKNSKCVPIDAKASFFIKDIAA